jgi:hypothetical protein
MSGDPNVQAEMPLYKSHKTVRAVKIKEVVLHDPTGSEPALEFAGGFIIPEGDKFVPIPFDADFFNKHLPEAGGYYVVYADGYASFSPAKAFEEGYVLAPAKVSEDAPVKPDEAKVALMRALIDSVNFIEVMVNDVTALSPRAKVRSQEFVANIRSKMIC